MWSYHSVSDVSSLCSGVSAECGVQHGANSSMFLAQEGVGLQGMPVCRKRTRSKHGWGHQKPILLKLIIWCLTALTFSSLLLRGVRLQVWTTSLNTLAVGDLARVSCIRSKPSSN